VLLSSGDSFPHLIQKRRSQIGFVTYLLNYLRICCVMIAVHSFLHWRSCILYSQYVTAKSRQL